MRRIFEAIFRHFFRLLLFIVLFPIVGVAIVYLVVPRTYQANASLWALRRYAVIGATGLETDLTSTPASTQATALDELLQTHDFVALVVKGINLAPTLNLDSSVLNDPQQLQNALFTEISKNVVVTPSAYNLFEISYPNRDPQVAQQIVASIIRNYGTQSLSLSIAEGQDLLTAYQTQLAKAQQDLSTATEAEATYVRAHPSLLTPGVDPNADPQYAQLDAQRLQAQANVQTIQTTISTIQQSLSDVGTSTNTLFQVFDSPQVPDRPVSRLKSYLVGGGAGLAIALLACVIYLVILVRRDHGIYVAEDVSDLIAFPVIFQVPELERAAVTFVAVDTEHRPFLLAERTNGATSYGKKQKEK